MRWLRVVAPPHLEAATAEELQPLRLPICCSFNLPGSRGHRPGSAPAAPLTAAGWTLLTVHRMTALISTVCPAAARGGGHQQLRLVHLSNCSGR